MKKRTRQRTKKRAKNALFSADRLLVRRPRVTALDWKRAGDHRRIQAVKFAGVSSKNAPAYATLEWADLQSMEPGFVTKLMQGLARTFKKNPRRTPRRKYLSPIQTAKKKVAYLRGWMQKHAFRGGATVAKMRTDLANTEQRLQKLMSTKRTRKTRNPKTRAATRRAVKTYTMFHGRKPRKVTTKVVRAQGLARTSDYTKLGDLVELHLPVGVVTFKPGERPILATDNRAKRLYLIGGNQDLSAAPAQKKNPHGLDDLGECVKIVYFTRKKFDRFEPFEYVHTFGDEGGQAPRLMFDRKRKQAHLVGGSYTIKAEGIRN